MKRDMKGIDTNVLVRYLLQDDLAQSRQATHFIEERCSASEPAFINGIVLCELVWVLETAYDYPKESIVEVLKKILCARQFHIHEANILWKALHEYKNEKADFADHYIGTLNSQHECQQTFTFDKKAARLKYFKLLD